MNSERIVDSIIYDLTDRPELKHSWFELDREVRDGIKEEWIKIVDFYSEDLSPDFNVEAPVGKLVAEG